MSDDNEDIRDDFHHRLNDRYSHDHSCPRCGKYLGVCNLRTCSGRDTRLCVRCAQEERLQAELEKEEE